MKLFRVERAHVIGNGTIRVMVIAPDDARALSLAMESFEKERREEYEMRPAWEKDRPDPPVDPQDLRAIEQCADTSEEWASEVDDD